ncbi:hypothetical protein GCK72_002948 [Caenorhabditis remanei]|uniref:Uncharacterized protein n=1 Tax=Caenorhabditis remanei TaxID=31234 RepID=A0A6A5HXC3_CAERE|nr:hypothetical protein GCK72_002948 [Caenorhabditis remanei]KAF1771123.1 hypothetical protein GCK72_002948 [Caenorhabditis remanei]
MNRSSFKPEFLMPADLFTLMKSLRRGLVVGSKQIVNRVSEDDATGGHVCFLPELRFEMDNFCGSNSVLRKLHLLSNHCIYHQDTSIYPIRIGVDHPEYQLRKRTFDALKMAYQHLIQMWKDTPTKAPFKCKCLKRDGFHEKLTPFMTMISHRDNLFESWTLDRRSVVFAHQDLSIYKYHHPSTTSLTLNKVNYLFNLINLV